MASEVLISPTSLHTSYSWVLCTHICRRLVQHITNAYIELILQRHWECLYINRKYCSVPNENKGTISLWFTCKCLIFIVKGKSINSFIFLQQVTIQYLIFYFSFFFFSLILKKKYPWNVTWLIVMASCYNLNGSIRNAA